MTLNFLSNLPPVIAIQKNPYRSAKITLTIIGIAGAILFSLGIAGCFLPQMSIPFGFLPAGFTALIATPLLTLITLTFEKKEREGKLIEDL